MLHAVPILQAYTSEPDVHVLLDTCVGRLARRGAGSFEVEEEHIRHIADWLRAALVNDEPWLKNVDGQGRPKKLLKFGSVDAIVREADKAMLKASQRLKVVTLVEGDEELVEMLEDGYYVVRLLTPAALDRESAQMQHCIGNGAYDKSLSDGLHTYLSLRDVSGKAHATIAIRGGRIVQFQGKQNKLPIRKYLDVFAPYILTSGLKVGLQPRLIGYVFDIDGVWHPLENLPEGLTVEGDLYLFGSPVTELPKCLKVTGSLNLRGVHIRELPDGLSVGKSIDLSGTKITRLPMNLDVKEDLDLVNTRITALPEDMKVGRDLHLEGTAITSLPQGIKVGRDVYLQGSAITELPMDLGVGGGFYFDHSKIMVLPKGLKVRGDLSLQGTEIKVLPEGLSVEGDLNINYTDIANLPEGLSVGGGLYLGDTKITELPEGLNLRGGLNISNTAISALPDRLTVRKDINMNNTKITELPKGLKVGGVIHWEDNPVWKERPIFTPFRLPRESNMGLAVALPRSLDFV